MPYHQALSEREISTLAIFKDKAISTEDAAHIFGYDDRKELHQFRLDAHVSSLPQSLDQNDLGAGYQSLVTKTVVDNTPYYSLSDLGQRVLASGNVLKYDNSNWHDRKSMRTLKHQSTHGIK